MALSHKHYEAVAQIIRDNAAFCVRTQRPDGVAALAETAEDFADWFESDNDRFDRDRFLKACATA